MKTMDEEAVSIHSITFGVERVSFERSEFFKTQISRDILSLIAEPLRHS